VAILEAENISVDYGSRRVVSDVSVEVDRGEILAILGPNGAGKSTFLRCLNGALLPSTGSITLDGRNLSSYNRRQIARKMSVVAQETEVRFPVTVLEFVLGGRFASAGPSVFGWESAEDAEIAIDSLVQTDLVHFRSRLMNELSGGERQRAVLARALATRSEVMLLDEPTTNLDLAHQEEMFSIVRQLGDEQKTCAVVITHDVNLAAAFGDEILLLKDGRAIAKGKPETVLTREILRVVFSTEVLIDKHPILDVVRVTPAFTLRRSI
jgi:iron complex transport system ATP-binding protein